MAIQLNERDHLIFQMIDEHHVLLEKHISWFVSQEDKPVLIRDRLRKLFYLDYLLCQRHNTKLPWWTTPTKPLVYMLSPLSKSLSGSQENELDILDDEIQRHFLEIANIRMLCLVASKSNEIEDLQWTTCKSNDVGNKSLDAKISFRVNSPNNIVQTCRIGIINHPINQDVLIDDLQSSFKDAAIESVAIVCRDQLHGKMVQQWLHQHNDRLPLEKILLVTHHELYKHGIVKAPWVTADPEAPSASNIIRLPQPPSLQPRLASA